MKNLLKRAKRFAPAVVGSCAMAAGSLATSVLATGTADAGVTAAFTTVGENISATVAAVAPYAIGVMACILGFRYAKKIFKVIANG
jgi:hypothetical protein